MKLLSLGQLVEIKTGKLDANAAVENGQYPFFTCAKKESKIDKFSFDCEAILIAGNGDLNVKRYKGKFDAYQRTYVLSIKRPTDVHFEYLYYFLEGYVEKLREMSIGGVIKYIKLGMLTEAKIPLPPLETQKQIAAVLEKADQLRKDCQQMGQELSSLAQSVFIDMFGDPVMNPKGWDVLTIGELTSKVTDGEHQTPKRAESGYKLLSARNVQHGYLDVVNEKVDYVGEAEFERITKRLLIENSDVLLSCSGTIGRAAMNTLNEPFCLVRSVAVIRLVQEHMLPEFLVGYLATSYMQAVMHHEANSSGQPNLFQNQIKKLKVYCPPIKSQKKFKTFIESQKTKLIQLKVLRGEYDEAFNSLMQKAFKGELTL